MEILTVKEISTILAVSDKTARNYRKDMLLHYKPKSGKITKEHLNDYFSLPK